MMTVLEPTLTCSTATGAVYNRKGTYLGCPNEVIKIFPFENDKYHTDSESF